jgi:GT2 family glycosyltransferase
MTVRNYSAVTAAVMMTRREVWNRVGGFDERLRVDFNDVDFCLKVRQSGYRIVYTPFVECYHHESGSFGAREQTLEDVEEMQRKWPDALRRDPYYNSNLSQNAHDCRLPE